MPRAGF